MRLLIALGGNAIKQADEEGTSQEQLKNCQKTCKFLAEIISRMGYGDRLIITHGNGPQVGNLLVQQEEAKNFVPAQNMDILVAMTQGQIGYMLQQELVNCLRDMQIDTPVCSIINRVLVDKKDPEFIGENASKPVGNFLTRQQAAEIKRKHHEYIIKKVKPNGLKCWRKCVPSPLPIANVDDAVIKTLCDAGIIVIASGGGGIPTIVNDEGHYEGIEAVIDKDLSAVKLAKTVNADMLLVLTDIEHAKISYGKPGEKNLKEIGLADVKKLFEEGHFLSGSMGPKMKACINFVENGGKKAVITSLEKAVEGFEGQTGTIICTE